jgi:hypothetical protein
LHKSILWPNCFCVRATLGSSDCRSGLGLLGRSAPQDAMLRTRGSRREARVETKTIGSDQFPPNRLGRSLHPSYLQRRMFLPQFLEVLLATGKLHEVEIIFTLTLLWEGEMPNKSCTKDLNLAQILQVLHKYFKSCINFPSSLSVFRDRHVPGPSD